MPKSTERIADDARDASFLRFTPGVVPPAYHNKTRCVGDARASNCRSSEAPQQPYSRLRVSRREIQNSLTAYGVYGN